MTGWFDADAHVIEPVGLWHDYAPAALRPRLPSLVHRDGADWFVCDGVELFAVGRIGGLKRGDRTLPLGGEALSGTWEASIVEGAYRVPQRLEAMRTDGVERALLYPTIAMSLLSTPDRGLLRELLRAYNRWIADFCAEAPDRLLSCCLVDPDDHDEALAQIETARAHGHVAVLVPLWSESDTDLLSPDHERLWAAAAAHGLPVGFHAFASRQAHRVRTGLDLAIESVATRPARVVHAITGLLFSGVFERLRGLRWFSAENDAGWVGYLVERADTLFRRARHNVPITRPPSELFHDHVFVTFTDERVALAAAPLVGRDNLMWGSDYPHNVTTWPDSHAGIDRIFDELAVAPATRAALTFGNAARLFHR